MSNLSQSLCINSCHALASTFTLCLNYSQTSGPLEFLSVECGPVFCTCSILCKQTPYKMCFSPFFSKGTLTATAFQFSSCCYNFARHVCLYINTKGMGTTLPTSPTPPYKIFLCRHFLAALPTSAQFYLSKTWAWDRNQISSFSCPKT